MRKYPVYMWMLAISDLERQGKRNLCLAYLIRMLDVFEDVLEYGTLYNQRFSNIISLSVIRKQEKKRLKLNLMNKITEKVKTYIHLPMEDLL